MLHLPKTGLTFAVKLRCILGLREVATPFSFVSNSETAFRYAKLPLRGRAASVRIIDLAFDLCALPTEPESAPREFGQKGYNQPLGQGFTITPASLGCAAIVNALLPWTRGPKGLQRPRWTPRCVKCCMQQYTASAVVLRKRG